MVIYVGILGAMDAIADSDLEEWWNTWTVNLKGPYLITRAILPLMLKSGDKTIVTVSSVGAHLTGKGLSAYQPSKLAVLRLMEFVGAEYGEQGVVAYCVHPGNVVTDIVGGEEGLPPFLKPGEYR
jgi:NAD(P)-dependent dehydrogenase (short-subunit alcohol dehydrogenase family)